MRKRLARSLCPELTVIAHRPDHEARAFDTVVEHLSSVLADPLVARPGLVLSAVAGPARWAGGEEEVAEALVELVAHELGIESQAGVGDSLLVAVLAARRGVIVPAGQGAQFLAPWPLEELTRALMSSRLRRQAGDVIDTLRRLGVRTIGALAGLDRADVTARFGPLGGRLHSLASATHTEVPRQERPHTDIQVWTELDPPVSQVDAVVFAARSLAQRLSEQLARHACTAGRVRVDAERDDGEVLSRTWLIEAGMTAEEIAQRVRWQVDGWLSRRAQPGTRAPLTGLRVIATDLRHVSHVPQPGLWALPGQESRDRAVRGIERLEALLGPGSVRQPRHVPGRDPRSRIHMLTWGEGHERAEASRRSRGARPRPVQWMGTLPHPSPATVLDERQPIDLTDRRGREVLVDAHGQLLCEPYEVNVGHRYTIVSWAGPWPVDEGWWRPGGADRRVYLQLQPQEGPALLVVRAGRWWLEGRYD